MSNSVSSSVANYGGSITDSKQFVKQFIVGSPRNLAIWKNTTYRSQPSGSNIPINTMLLTPAVTKTGNNTQIPVYIPTDLYVDGLIYGQLATPSDKNLKDNI
jgi:hypothetical protein